MWWQSSSCMNSSYRSSRKLVIVRDQDWFFICVRAQPELPATDVLMKICLDHTCFPALLTEYHNPTFTSRILLHHTATSGWCYLWMSPVTGVKEDLNYHTWPNVCWDAHVPVVGTKRCIVNGVWPIRDLKCRPSLLLLLPFCLFNVSLKSPTTSWCEQLIHYEVWKKSSSSAWRRFWWVSSNDPRATIPIPCVIVFVWLKFSF